MTEVWLSLPNDSNYEVSDLGRVRSTFFHGLTPNILTPSKDSNGYMRVTIHRVPRKAHKLVLLTFVGNCPDDKEASHKDSNKENNALSNLCYETHADNMARHQIVRGQKLTLDDVAKIRDRIHNTSYAMLASEYGVSISHIGAIARNERWKI